MDFSLHVLNRSARSSAYSSRHKDTIRRRSALNRLGATATTWKSSHIGGDAQLGFALPDPGNKDFYRVQMEEPVELYLGTSRLCQAIADDAPRRDDGLLRYECIGHFAWNMKKNPICHAAGQFGVDTWLIGMIFRNSGDWLGTTWIADRAQPWVNSSEKYVETGLTSVRVDPSGYGSSEKLLADLLQFVDQEAGMFPGPDTPAELGCYVYFQPRLRNRVDWIISRRNLMGGSVDIELNYDFYDHVVYKWTKSDGSTGISSVVNETTRAKYTPGSYASAFLDLTSGNGWMTDANAQACARVWLDMHDGTVPMAKGTITLPFAMVQHTSMGMRHSAFIRAWDNIRIPHLDCYQFDTSSAKALIDNRTTFHVYQAEGDVDAGTVKLEIGEESREFDALVRRFSNPSR